MADSNASEKPKKASKKSKKRKLYDLHMWLGFHLAFLMTIVLFTGTIAVVSDEIDWLVKPAMRVSEGKEKVSWGTMEAAVKAAAPDHMMTSLEAGEADYFAYRATLLRPDLHRYYMYINQWTGEITGTSSGLTVQRFFRDLHRYLFMPNFIGLPIVSSLAFVLIISLYTGYKTVGSLGKAATRMRTNRGARVLVGDLHKAAGVWSIWFFIVVIITAIWYLAEFGAAVSGERFEPDRPGLTSERVSEFGDVMLHLDADTLVKNAKAALPNWEPKQILYALFPSQATTVLGDTSDFLVRSRANRVFLDPVDGSIIKAQKSTEISTVAYLNEVADPLHFGSFGALITKLIWFFFGILMTGMSVSGVWLTYRRLKQTFISKAQVATFPIILASMLVGYFYVDRYVATDENSIVIAHGTGQNGIITAEAFWREGIDSGNNYIELFVRHPNGRPMIKSATIANKAGDEVDLKFRTFAETTTLRSDFLKPNMTASGAIITLIQLASGESIRLCLPATSGHMCD